MIKKVFLVDTKSNKVIGFNLYLLGILIYKTEYTKFV